MLILDEKEALRVTQYRTRHELALGEKDDQTALRCLFEIDAIYWHKEQDWRARESVPEDK